ncbi:hypothetical protein OGAPHI_002332 [Ogataea philodendri]|uniref:Dolichyl-phosphate-mannose--protein mannosyltransferase n=1 Tax=Ogataea philodendri TaxID=1378263 RepID=A0A9P8PAG9_9ASCO|nr:uncharacterized protein OGAPHI_002332 [Ogataea philodendri]KAH3668578.1 hypothetical protein OGAPHI_002332 [Ogataea philodendri]
MSLSNGPSRKYYKSRSIDLDLPKDQRVRLLMVVVLALALRLIGINYPSTITGFESRIVDHIVDYSTGSFFVDPNPPLVPLLYSCVSKFTGLDTPLVLLRSLSALYGTATVLLTYRTLQACGVGHKIAIGGSLLIAFENSFVQESSYISDITPTLFFLSLTVALTKTISSGSSRKRTLVATIVSPIALGLLISSDWIGLASAAWVLTVFVRDTWLQIGDLSLSTRTVVKQALFRLSLLLVIPVSIYLSIYAVYLHILPHTGPGYSLVSPHFQNALDPIPPYVADISYGSTVSLRSYFTGKYLHSEASDYPKSGNQRVTASPTDTEGNLWFVEQRIKARNGELVRKAKQIETGRQIRFFHNATERYLYINTDGKPPLSETDYNKEVSTFGNSSWEGENWINFELRPASRYSTSAASKRFRAIESVFQIYNVRNKCFLMATENALPSWAQGHDEVICIEKPIFERSLWYFVKNEHPKLEGSPVEYRNLSFFDKLKEVHVQTLRLVGKLPKWTVEDQNPLRWPFLEEKTLLWRNGDEEIWSTGNPVVYWTVIMVVVGFVGFKAFQVITLNPYKPAVWSIEELEFDRHATDFLLGFVIHLIPYVLSNARVEPAKYSFALFFGVLLFCQWLEYMKAEKVLAAIIALTVIVYRMV